MFFVAVGLFQEHPTGSERKSLKKLFAGGFFVRPALAATSHALHPAMIFNFGPYLETAVSARSIRLSEQNA